MASHDAFLPQSQTILVVTNGTTLTPSTQAVVFPGIAPALMGPFVPPPVALILNLAASVVWISITLAARTAAIPAAGQTSFEVPIAPNQSLCLRTPWGPGGGGSEGAAGASATLNINTIAVGTSLQLAVAFGEGKL
jgi:hypothetical protein